MYPDKSIAAEFTTKAMAEGAIEGTAADYVLPSLRATAFAYSRFESSEVRLPMTRGAMTRIARVTDDGVDEQQATEFQARRLSETQCPCPSPSPLLLRVLWSPTARPRA